MNLPNKLTLLRVLLVPVFLIFMYISVPYSYTIALVIFAVASITDALDGHIARKNHLVTNFGKFLDPLADKVLVIAALAVFAAMPEVNMGAVPLIIIVSREFMVSGLRLIAADSGVVVAAGIWGKLKTAFTMVTIVAILVWLAVVNDFGVSVSESVSNAADIITAILIWISVALTVISGAVYRKGYWHLIDSDK